jgi:hypothetical protein
VGATLVLLLIIVGGAMLLGGDGTTTDDPLTQMSVVFEGDYSRSEVKDIVDASLGTFDIPVNDANRRDVGDLALKLAEDSDKNEMEIIACVSATGPGEGEEYEDMTKWENYEVVAAGCGISN